MIMKNYLLAASCFMQLAVYSQVIEPNIQDTAKWNFFNRTGELINENGKKGIRLS